jgi:hypothetical protein
MLPDFFGSGAKDVFLIAEIPKIYGINNLWKKKRLSI